MRALTLLVGLVLPTLALAGRPSDAALWTKAEVEIEASDTVDVEVGQQLRLGTAVGDGTEALTDLGVDVSLAKWFTLGAGYRLGLVDWDAGPQLRHRLSIDGTAGLKGEHLRLSLRERYQVRVPTAEVSIKHVWRSRLGAKWKSDLPVVPHVGIEPFVELGDGPATLAKWRFEAGLEIPIQQVELDLSYRLEEPAGDPSEPRLHIIGLALGWSW